MDLTQKFDWQLTIKPYILFLHTSGLVPQGYKPHKLDLYTVRTVFLITVFALIGIISQIINLFFIFDNLTSLTGSIYNLLTEIISVLKFCLLIKNMPILEHLMKILSDDLFQPKNINQRILIQPNLDFWKRVFQTYVMGCCAAILFFTIFPFLDTSSNESRLPFLAWYPYDTKISPFFEITCLHQVLSYGYACFNTVSIDALIAALNVYTGIQFDILCDNLRNLHKSDDVYANFTKNIKHHLLILSFAENCDKFFKWTIVMQFCVSTTVIGITLFQLTLVTPLSLEFFYCMSYGLVVVGQIFAYCWFGNEVQIKSATVPYAIYECSWTDFSIKMQKNILFLIMKAQKSVKVSALNVFYLSLESFMKIMKTSWSYFALLQQVSSDA